jgi:hypothetical protein
MTHGREIPTIESEARPTSILPRMTGEEEQKSGPANFH